LDDYREYVRQRYEQFGLSAPRLLEEIRAQGYSGSVYPIRRFIQTLTAPAKAASKATVRFETPPGEQAQADWAYCGRFTNAEGKAVPIYAFVMVLGFSRMLFVRFTTSMQVDALIECHLKAFEFFDGCTRSILYDNMKQVRIQGGRWNPLFLDFADYHGFALKTHQPRRPRTKGKVERSVRYVKESFLTGRSFADVDNLNAEARHWLDTVANVRVHATTNQRPVDLLAKEELMPVGTIAPYRLTQRSVRKVDKEGYVRIARSRYSVPPDHVGKAVLVVQDDTRVSIRCDDLVIAEHPRASQRGECVASPEHIEAMWRHTATREARPAPPPWDVRFDESVAVVSLESYDKEVIQ
jgi:transposase